MKHFKIHKFPFKNVIVLAIECKMYLKIQQNLRWLGCISKQTMGSAVKKTRLNPRRTISWWKASLSPQKESWEFFWTFSFHFLSFNGAFLTLKCRTLVLKHLHGDRSPAMVKMNIHKHWTRVTRFNPLWVWVSVYSCFEKGCRKKCTRQSRKVLWVVLSALFSKEIWKNATRGHGHMLASANGKQQK